ncbi:MAG: hypothetical protein FWD06_00335 [Oscillospiraceae bacterium]|nr:hypothetical protein [Oscillospiraceae bacterium]
MKKLPLALLALLMTMVMLFTACSSAVYDNGNDETTTELYTEEYTEPVDETTEPEEETTAPEEDVLPADADADEDNDDDRPPLPVGNAAILAEYAAVMQQIKDRQPTYTSVNFQRITNRNQIPEDMLAMLDDSFFEGGSNNLFPAIVTRLVGQDSRMLTPESRARANPDRRVHGRPDGGGRFPGGGLGSTARWIGVSRNNAGSLGTLDHVRGPLRVQDRPDGMRQIEFTIADARNPRAIDEGAAVAPNAIAAFMEVVEIAEVLEMIENRIVRNAFAALGVNLRTSSWMEYSGSTIRAIYDPVTLEAVQIYKVGRLTINFHGTIARIDTTDHPIRMDAVFDFNNFNWRESWPA